MSKNQKKIRVALIVGKMVGGGVESVLIDILTYVNKEKYEFDFIIDDDSTFIPTQKIRENGGNIILVPPYQHIIKYVRTLIKLFKKNNYVIVHANISALNVFPMFAAFVSRVPVRIAHNHNLVAPHAGILKNSLKRILGHFNTLFPNYYVAPTIQTGKWTFKHKKVEIIKNGIKSKQFLFSKADRVVIRNKLKIQENEIVIGSFGRVVQSKRLDFCISLLQRLSTEDEHNNYKLLLIGDGKQRQELEKVIENNSNLKSNVLFLHNQSQISKFYSAIDVYVFPSSSEAFGLAAVEAQTEGLPTLVSKGIPDEAKISEELFYKLNELDTLKWSKQIIGLCSSNKNRQEISRKTVVNNPLDSRIMAKNVEAFYDRTVKNNCTK